MNGKLADEAAGFLDIVLYMYTALVTKDDESTIERRVLSAGTDDIVAKDRSDKLPDVLQDPTFEKIVTLIKGVDHE